MPPGHNGSYHDLETPVRNTAHWLITFLKAYDISGKQSFLDAAHKAADYLSSSDARPMDATFWHRKNPEKDTCNGLMGQAWTIEALTIAAEALDRPELLTLSEQVFLLHPHNSKTGLWQSVSVDGTYLDFDYTFNHQLWFAAAGGLLAKHALADDINLSVQCFLDHLDSNFRVHSSGLIRHIVSFQLFPTRRRVEKAASKVWKIRNIKKLSKRNKYLEQKEIGYHSFNLYAFSLLRRAYPTHSFWKNKQFLSSLDYVRSEDYSKHVRASKYGYPYNPPGFEIPFVLETFFADEESYDLRSQWVSEQLSQCYDFDSNLMTNNTADKHTHAARIYEATRLSDLALNLQEKTLSGVA
ncbi:agl cluster protein AglQ [cf. Phormidesmis sp. LEGE 11477]|uniref:agl cluster protein AglQ n=1 Tax=cf. Phormidesmis sp. LEGE 11477 TaxID=1828680 RepID=UPI001882896F|nr:agl cluster protein AglQ [cf. Phormidesmis sp. LEGE 11477]MBE9061260.1 agl cluster protein AglQ [cf. Phormidesmis sp. LEGE 11477]